MTFSPEELTAYATAAATAVGILAVAIRKAAGAWQQIRDALGIGSDGLHRLVKETRDLAVKNDQRNADLDERQTAHEVESLQAREEMQAQIRDLKESCMICKAPARIAAVKGRA